MALEMPSPEDQLKIHAEITQIANQRVQNTTFAITLFGVIGAWSVQKLPPTNDSDIGNFAFYTAALLTCLLFVLYVFNHVLKGMMRIFSSYLVATQASKWETDWERYRVKGYFGYTKAQTYVFLILGFLSFMLSFGLAQAYSLNLNRSNGFWTECVAWLTYTGAISAMGFWRRLDPERNAQEKWKSLKRPRVTIIGLGAYFTKLRPGIDQQFELEQLIDQRPECVLGLSTSERQKFRQLAVGYEPLRLNASTDCIMLLTPPGLRVAQLERLVGNMKPIFIEKPLATNLHDLASVRMLATKHPRFYCSDYYVDVRAVPLLSWLFPDFSSPLLRGLEVKSGNKDLWLSGPKAFGTLERVEAVLLENEGFEGRPWLTDGHQGGVVLDLMYHYFSLCAHISQDNLEFDQVELKTLKEDGSFATWEPHLGAETYAAVRGHLGTVEFDFKVAKFWREDAVRSFTLCYSDGKASMLFESPNRLNLQHGESECVVVLNGVHDDLVAACFADYLRIERHEAHNLPQSLRAVKAACVVKEFAMSRRRDVATGG